jgi:HlyD family secretion protein
VDVRVKELPSNWTIGQRAEVFIETGHKSDALVVPQRFIQWREGKPGVFIAEGGNAAWRNVTLGLRGREMVEATQGLSAGEKVVTSTDSKQQSLKPGQRIIAK